LAAKHAKGAKSANHFILKFNNSFALFADDQAVRLQRFTYAGLRTK